MTDWVERAACVKSTVEMFPYVSQRWAVKEALAVCASCPVRPECKAEADARGEQYGVWGGEHREPGGSHVTRHYGMSVRWCIQCGAEYPHTGVPTRYCSNKCRRVARRAQYSRAKARERTA